MASKRSSLKSTLIGITGGLLISAGLLLFLALWPLPDETFIPQNSPSIPTPPSMTAESPPVPPPQPTLPEVKPPDTGINRPHPAELSPIKNEKPAPPTAADKDRDISKQAEPAKRSKPDKAAVKPNRETKRAARETSAAPAPPPPPSVSRPDPAEIDSMLSRLKSACLEKDLPAIKKIVVLSVDEEESLNIIFNSYKSIKVAVEPAELLEDRVMSAIVMTSLENEKGNAVTPGPRWRKLPLLITQRDNLWNQVVLANDALKSSPKNPVDLIAPAIIHSLPTYTAKSGEPTVISAAITDNLKVAQAALHFRAQGEKTYESTRMTEGPDHVFTGQIPGSMIKSGSSSMEYYIEAKDSEGNLSLEGRPSAPLVIAVVPIPSE